MLKYLRFLLLASLFPPIASAYYANWTRLEMNVDVLNGNIWDGTPTPKSSILKELSFLEDGDRDNERLAQYTSENFAALLKEASSLFTAASKEHPLFEAFVRDSEGIYSDGDDRVKKSIHLVLERVVKEARTQLEWLPKLEEEAKTGRFDYLSSLEPSAAGSLRDSSVVAAASHRATSPSTKGTTAKRSLEGEQSGKSHTAGTTAVRKEAITA